MTPTEEAAKLARELAEADWPVDVYGEPASQKCAAKFMPILTAAFAERDEELKRLREEVERHHRQRGNDKCWENDNDLYVAFGLEPHSIQDLPPIEEYKRNCEAYRCALYQMLQPKEPNNES